MEIQAATHDVTCRIAIPLISNSQVGHTAEALVVEIEIEILDLDRPVPAEQPLEPAADGVPPIEILSVSINQPATARTRVAIVDNSRFVVHANGAGGRVNEPATVCEADS